MTTKLVVKPDQLIKRRGKAGLLAINKSWPEVVSWIKERMNKECKVEVVTGILDHFIVEPFVPHAQSDEYYICLQVLDSPLLSYSRNFHNLHLFNVAFLFVLCNCRAFVRMTRFSSTTKEV